MSGALELKRSGLTGGYELEYVVTNTKGDQQKVTLSLPDSDSKSLRAFELMGRGLDKWATE